MEIRMFIINGAEHTEEKYIKCLLSTFLLATIAVEIRKTETSFENTQTNSYKAPFALGIVNMKVHFLLSLLAILSTAITAMPLHESDIETTNDLTHLAKRTKIECLSKCGQVAPRDCVTTIKNEAIISSGAPVCANSPFIVFTQVNECEIAFAGHKASTTCISGERLTGLAREILDACVRNSEINTGGCIDIESDGGRVCLRNEKAGDCF